MTDLADEIYEATGMILGTQQAAAMTAFVRTREAAARHEAAAEIERLRAALRSIVADCDAKCPHWSIRDDARAALGKNNHD